MKSKKLLILGGDSKIGRALYLTLKGNYSIWKSTRKSSIESDEFYFELSDKNHFSTLPNEKFDFVFVCISITSIDYCQNNIIESNKINVNQTIELIEYFHNKGSFIIYFSTNLVFDGTKKSIAYYSKVNPQTVYGQQKVQVENFLTKIDASAVIRMTKIIDENFKLFENWISCLAENRKITAFSDMYMSPVWIYDLMNFLKAFILNPKSGVYHLSSETDISYYEAAIYIAQNLNSDTKLVKSVSYKECQIKNVPLFTSLSSNINDYYDFSCKNKYYAINKFLLYKSSNR